MLRTAAALLIVLAAATAAGLAPLVPVAAQQGQQQTTPPSEAADPGAGRAALGRIALGFVLGSAGATAFILAIVYKGPVRLALFSFGMFSLLYGVRILISVPAIAQLLGVPRRSIFFAVAWINYLLPAFGLLFAEQIRGRGWLSSLRVSWLLAFVMAAAFIVTDLVRGVPWSGLSIYRTFLIVTMLILLVHLVWWRHRDPVESGVRTIGTGVLALTVIHDNVGRFLPWNVSLEVYGLSVFILALGVVTARRFFADQRELAAVERELATARTIQESILPRTVPTVIGGRVAVRYIPARSVAGDVYDFNRLDEHRLGVLIADVAGHGVPAALIASMATVAFSSQERYADDPGRTLAEINRVISGHFDARFVTAAYLFFDFAAGTVRYSLAGHPPPFLVRRGSAELVELDEGATVLGIFPDTAYPTTELAIGPGDRLVLYTDGLTDVANGAGDWFGRVELNAFVRANAALTPETFVDALVERVRQWTGRAHLHFEDDLTVMVIDVENGKP